jgi:phenylpyruvate tautomerase PptA (4-oxalocrotonate tautomerase family)
MAQIKIYGLTATFNQYRTLLSSAIHLAVVEALSYPVEKKFQRFIGLETADFIYPADRSQHYLIIEISLFEGRSIETKKSLIRLLFAYIERDVGILPQDVEITIFETPKHHWGIRGMCGDELTLNYKVNV